MSITDELRHEVANYPFRDNRDFALFEAIADRIDAEHQKAIHELNCLAEASVLAPKDADGEYIHVGDVMEWVRYEDDDLTIVRKVSAVGAGVFFAWSDEQGRYAQYEAHAYRHYYAPTVKDVLREFAEKITDSQIPDVHPTYEEAIAEYAQKLQLREA